MFAPNLPDDDPETYVIFLHAMYGDRAKELLKIYPLGPQLPTPRTAAMQIIGDTMFNSPIRSMAKALVDVDSANVYFYQFECPCKATEHWRAGVHHMVDSFFVWNQDFLSEKE